MGHRWRARLVAPAGLAALAVAASGCFWTQPRYDAGHSGDNGAERTLTAVTVAGLDEAWSVGGQTGDARDVAVVKGTAVVTSGLSVSAYDVGTGALKWSSELVEDPPDEWFYGPPKVTPPTVVGDTVTVGLQVTGLSARTANSHLSFDLVTGAELPASPLANGHVATTSALTASDGLLWGASWGYTGGLGGYSVYGVSGVTPGGERLVADETITQGGVAAQFSAVAIGAGLAVYGAPGELRAIDAAGERGCQPETVPGVADFRLCEPLWRVPTGDVVETPVVRDGVAYATSTGGSLFALTVPPAGSAPGVSPEPRWSAAVPGATAPAVTAGGDLFVGSSAGGGRLEAYAGATCPYGADCAPAWVGPAGGAVAAAPVVAGDVVYVGSSAGGGTVSAFAAAGCGAASCAPLWSAATPGAPESISVAGGRVVVATAGSLVAFALPA